MITRHRDVTIRAPAKLNLGLRIGSSREDGFHSLTTIFQTIGLADEIEFRVDRSLGSDDLTVRGPVDLGEDPDNLVHRALEAIRSRGIRLPPLRIRLHKRIPPGSGLGGGSSDAAAVLHAAGRMVDGSDMAQIDLPRLAQRLGADVPFFLVGGTCYGSGTGEQLRPLPDQRAHVLVCVPEYGVSTAWAFENFRTHLSGTGKKTKIEPPKIKKKEYQFWKKLDLANDFEPLLEQTRNQHRRIAKRMRECSRHTSLTGSGSALFSLFETEEEARRASRQLREALPSVRVFVTQFLEAEKIPHFV